MTSAVIVVGAVYIVAGLFVIGLAIPLIARRVPMNRWYGVRIPKSFSSDSNWYAINSVGGWWLIVAGLVLVAGGIAILLYPPVNEAVLTILGLVPVVVVLLAVVPILLYARRMR